MDQQISLLELQKNIFLKIEDEAKKINDKIENEIKGEIKVINEKLNKLRDDTEKIPDLDKRITNLEEKMKSKKEYPEAAASCKTPEKQNELNNKDDEVSRRPL